MVTESVPFAQANGPRVFGFFSRCLLDPFADADGIDLALMVTVMRNSKGCYRLAGGRSAAETAGKWSRTFWRPSGYFACYSKNAALGYAFD